MKNKILMASFIVMISFLSLGADAAQKAYDIEKAREKISLLRERAFRDLGKAKELKEKSLTQIQNAEAIMEKVRQNPEDTTMDPVLVNVAPQALERGKKFLAEAEELLKQARLRVDWSDRAMKNLEGGKYIGTQAGIGFLTKSEGHWGVQPPGEDEVRKWPYNFDYLVEGDYIATEKDGLVELNTYYAPDFNITIGPETDATLFRDNMNETRWIVHEGKVHFKSEPLSQERRFGNIPMIETPRSFVEAEPGSEFDVYVEKGETKVQVYRGNVQQREPLFPDIDFDLEYGKKKKAKGWWE